MIARFSPSTARGTIAAPPSKTLAHRELMAAALSEVPSAVSGVLFSQDVLATLDCVRSLGAEVTAGADSVRIDPEDPADDFTITRFWMEDGKPMFELSHTSDGGGVSFEPRIKKRGKANLGDPWQDVPEGGNPLFRFFTVEVELP